MSEEVLSINPTNSEAQERIKHAATMELASVCKEYDGFEDDKDDNNKSIESHCIACVKRGADIFYRIPFLRERILHKFIKDRRISCFKICIQESPFDTLNFCLDSYYDGATALHYLCGTHLSDEETSDLLSTIVYRLETHPKDLIDWQKKDASGKDFLSCAAENQKLSVVWPLVREQPAFADSIDPLPLCGRVWVWDWTSLGEEEQIYFTLKYVTSMVEANKSTGMLLRVYARAEASVISRYVQDGADIHFVIPDKDETFFYWFIKKGDVEAVRACLQTKNPIDFTSKSRGGYNPLHYILLYDTTPETVRSMLNVMLDRLERCGLLQWKDEGNVVLSISSPTDSVSETEENDTTVHQNNTSEERLSGTTELLTRSEDFSKDALATKGDRVDWMQEDDNLGFDFLSMAAARGVLSVVWRVFTERKNTPFLSPFKTAMGSLDRKEKDTGDTVGEEKGKGTEKRIFISSPIRESDLDRIPENDKKRFFFSSVC